MEPPGLHRVECKPIRKERFPTIIFLRSNQFLGPPTLPAQAVALRYGIPGTHRRTLRPVARIGAEYQPAVPAYRRQRQSTNVAFRPTPPGARYSSQPPLPNRQGVFHLCSLFRSSLYAH